MKKKQNKTRKSYSPEFKREAIDLAKEIGATAAAEKLGVESPQTIGAWLRYDKKIAEDAEFKEIEQLRAENKQLRRELQSEKKAVAILRDAAAFFVRIN